MDEGMIDITKIPKFEFEINNDELKSCIKELHFQFKNQQKHIQKIKKDIQTKIGQTGMAEIMLLVDSNIDIDASLVRMISKKSEPKKEQSDLSNACNKLGYKIGQISQCLNVLLNKITVMDKKIISAQADYKSLISQKTTSIQSQLDDYKKIQNKQNRSLGDNLQITIANYEDKLREVESKTLWQINDCKTKLQDRVNEQFVKNYVNEMQTKVMTKVKESMIKSNIDPQRIDQIQNSATKASKEFQIKIIECGARLNELQQQIQQSLVTRKEINNGKIENQKKLGNIKISIADTIRKLKNSEMNEKDIKEQLMGFSNQMEETQTQMRKMGKMISNLKIGDDFQKLIEKLDPHKMCQIDTTLKALEDRDLKIERDLQAVKRYVEKLRQKTQICNLLAPSEGNGKLDKDQVAKIVTDLLSTNASIKKISSLQGQIIEMRGYGDMLNQINKRISRIQKQFDIQGVIYSLKGLEEYIKKQLMIMNTKLGQMQSSVVEMKRHRPLSARKTTDSKMTSSISYKKLTPVDCISCFQNPLSQKTSLMKKY